MKFLHLQNISILEQLQLEEALLRADEEDYCLINHGSSPAIVMGISGKPNELLDLPLVESLQIPVIQRFSGGGTVVVDENTLFVSFIGNHPITPCYPEPLMKWNATFFPHLTLFQNDFTIGDRKVGGNAQYIRKKRFVHHTTFLWEYDMEKMACLKHPNRTPLYRKGRDHRDFLTPLASHFDSVDDFLEPLMSRLPINQTVHQDWVRPILQRPHRKCTKILCEK